MPERNPDREMEDALGETARRARLTAEIGRVVALDDAQARARVQLEPGTPTTWLPWLTHAGALRTWRAPSVGEQVLVVSPWGDLARGVIVGGLFQQTFSAPANSPTLHRFEYDDGAQLDYDWATHTLRAVLPAGGTAQIVAPGGLAVEGDVTITGQVTVSEDVLASGISLTTHVHGGVQSGGSKTGGPE